MPPRNVLIVGASHSIGHALVDEFLKNPEIRNVIGTSRSPASHGELKVIKDSRFHLIEMNVSSDESIKTAFHKVEEIVGEEGLNLLVNDQGVMMEYFFDEKPNRMEFHHQLDVNTTAVMVICQTFLPLLTMAANHTNSTQFSVEKAAIINISSTLGSIEQNNGEWRDKNMTIYRVSKAALNALTRDLSFELMSKGILTVSLCPGSQHGSFYGNGTCSNHHDEKKMSDSAATLISTMARLRKEDSGRFFDKSGIPVPF